MRGSPASTYQSTRSTKVDVSWLFQCPRANEISLIDIAPTMGQNPEKFSRSAPRNTIPHPEKNARNSRPNSTPPTAHGGTDRQPDNRPDSYRPAGYTLTATDPGSGGWTGGTTESPATANPPTRVGRCHPRRIHHGRHRQATTSLSRAKWITC
jgi:hypothetical protein